MNAGLRKAPGRASRPRKELRRLAGEHAVSPRTRRFAKRSAIFSLALGMAGQVVYHLLAQAGMTRAP